MYEKNLKDELWGCFKYIGIPFDTLMKMSVRDRKYYILKHNEDVNGKNSRREKNTFNDMGTINNMASLEQSNIRSRR